MGRGLLQIKRTQRDLTTKCNVTWLTPDPEIKIYTRHFGNNWGIRIWAGYEWYYRIISFIRYYNGIVAIKKAVSILRKCRLKYLGVKYCDICATYFQVAQQKVIYLNTEKKQMWHNVNNWWISVESL